MRFLNKSEFGESICIFEDVFIPKVHCILVFVEIDTYLRLTKSNALEYLCHTLNLIIHKCNIERLVTEYLE